jgi:hypothetical protein
MNQAITRINSRKYAVTMVSGKVETFPSHKQAVRAWGAQMVEKTNLLSGKTYMESLDTPRYCSPSSEAYWSM